MRNLLQKYKGVLKGLCLVTSITAIPVTNAIAETDGFMFKPDQGKPKGTHGVSQIDGAGGGGLVPWALITGGGSKESWGANTHYTYIHLPSYRIGSYGFAVGLFDRVEFSYARHELRGSSGGLDGLKIDQNIFGAKVKLFGNALDQETWIPQVSAGLFYHDHAGIDSTSTPILPQSLTGMPEDLVPYASDDDGTDYYLAASKIFLKQKLLVNTTLRFTKANQFGLLGFGSPGSDRYEPMLEASIGYLFSPNIVFGAEYRMKPDNLKNIRNHPLGVSSVDAEEDAWDIFVAWFPSKNISVTAAYLNLGEILNPGQTALGRSNSKTQDGAYISLQIGF